MSTDEPCRVYWASHGCWLLRGHEGSHKCDCCTCDPHIADLIQTDDATGEQFICVGMAPYYGPETNFYGEDA